MTLLCVSFSTTAFTTSLSPKPEGSLVSLIISCQHVSSWVCVECAAALVSLQHVTLNAQTCPVVTVSLTKQDGDIFHGIVVQFLQDLVWSVSSPSGPLFSFDVHDDIRLVNDATVEKDEVRTFMFGEKSAQKKLTPKEKKSSCIMMTSFSILFRNIHRRSYRGLRGGAAFHYWPRFSNHQYKLL